jgi:Xaa-Pro aminopeptidase
MFISPERRTRIQAELEENGLDALFCRLSEHVLYFTGYWPRNHVAAAVVPAQGNPVLLLSEQEALWELDNCPPNSEVELVTFAFESPTILRGVNDAMGDALLVVFKHLGLEEGRIGIEQNVEMANVGIFQGEIKYPADPTWKYINTLLPKTRLVDATKTIMKLRSIKSTEEIQAIKLAIEIAGMGFQAAFEGLKPGMTETELAAVVESAIHTKGTGYKGIKQARGYACVYSGARSANQWVHYAYSTEKVIQKDDMVIIELGCFADGYWADLTRNYCAGNANSRVRDLFKIAHDAQKAAFHKARAGVIIAEVVETAERYLDQHGCSHLWLHGLGHGVGTAYHEGPPLHKAYYEPLEVGMVLTLEPGIYVDGLGGFRPEDMILITEAKPELLSVKLPHPLS